MSIAKTKVTFLRNYTVQDAEGKTYEKGKTYAMSEASANHFINRGAAEIAATKTKETA